MGISTGGAAAGLPATAADDPAGSDGEIGPAPGPAMPADRGQLLAEQILAWCGQAGLRAGSRLPTERQFALDLGVTRTSVRRALAVLEADGRISREVGRGTFLQEARWPRPVGPAAFLPDGDEAQPRESAAAGAFSPADVMAIRRLVEPPAMKLVVAWATAADFREIERCLAGGQDASGYDEFELWDLALHRSIIAASHSPLLNRLYGVIDEARHSRFWGDLKRRSASRERQQLYHADHQSLVDELRARDADRATAAMRAHLARVSSYMFTEAVTD